MKKPVFFVTIIVITILVLSIVQVTVSNRLSTTGIVLGEMQGKIKTYQRENVVLSEKILSASSFSNIASEAASLGFVDSKAALFLSTPLPVAMESTR